MDWLTSQLPDSVVVWLLIIIFVLVLLNVYQFAHAHSLKGLVDHFHVFGHAPEGHVVVPADSIAHVIDEPAIRPAIPPPPWRT